MTLPPLGCTHDRQRRASHDIAAFGQHTRSNDVGRGMPSSPLGSTHGRTTLGVACHHSPWTANTVKQRQIGMPSSPLGSTNGRTTSGVACHHRLWATQKVERRWALHAIIAFGQHKQFEKRRAWHAIIAFGKHTRSNNVERGMQS